MPAAAIAIVALLGVVIAVLAYLLRRASVRAAAVEPTGDGIAAAATDLSELKRSEESLRAAREEAERARAEAEAANRMKDQFLATLSHELRAPVHAIAGWT